MGLLDCKAKTNPVGEAHNSAYHCVQRCPPKLPESGNTLGPWVAIQFSVGGGAGNVITVGNDSSPGGTPKNGAVITSFSFGHETGITVRVTIHDQAGGSFQIFMDNLLKDWACTEGSAVNNIMKFQFGWCKAGCPHPYPDACSPCYYAVMDSIETSFMEGKFISEITGKDICSRMFEGGTEKPYGGEGFEGMCLKTAINEMLVNSEDGPNVGAVGFQTYMGGMVKNIGFEYYDIDCEENSGGAYISPRHRHALPGDKTNKGPKGKWITAAEDKLSIARRWLSGWRTVNKKSWVEVFDPTVPNGKVVYWEDRKPLCVDQGDGYWSPTCIGTYIVNGGKRSPVIEFNPKIRWDFSRMNSVGGASSSEVANALDTEGSKTPGRIDCPSLTRDNLRGAGAVWQTTSNEVHKEFWNKLATKKAQEAHQSFARAQESVLLHNMIEADLVVVGDPTIVEPIFAREQKNVEIVFVNPYYLTNKGSESCPDWLSIPATNPVLSNLAWIVYGVTHKIELGRYTTTLNVKLAVPGVEADTGAKLGMWTGGWKPKGMCH